MASDFYSGLYNPDVLTCLANLSNDEVFTPPNVANQMLDMLPDTIWRDSSATFLDPACKSGVFLREIAKRLIDGLTDEIPDLQERIDHIFQKQLYGIAITELTSLLSRRSVYCSKYPNGKYSISAFEDASGNIRYKRTLHRWQNGRCVFCGASQSEYERGDELETHAYEWIHTVKPEGIFNMKFDVIIGNPPYQLGDGGNNASAVAVYNKFVEQAKKLNPRYLSMIIPSRWFAGGRGLDGFRREMLTDKHLIVIHDFMNGKDCFQGIRNGGGICYFLWNRDTSTDNVHIYNHDSNGVFGEETRNLTEFGSDIFVRSQTACTIIRKVRKLAESSMASIVLPQKPYGLRTNFADFDESGDLKVYTKKSSKGYSFVQRRTITRGVDSVDKYKVVTSRSTSVPEEDNGQVLRMAQTFIAEPNSIVTESYVVMATFDKKVEADNFYSYVQTRFFRFLCQPTIVSPDVSRRTFVFVPVQNFTEPWTDEKLYAKYGLTDEEIAFIESMIRPMELGGDTNGD